MDGLQLARLREIHKHIGDYLSHFDAAAKLEAEVLLLAGIGEQKVAEAAQTSLIDFLLHLVAAQPAHHTDVGSAADALVRDGMYSSRKAAMAAARGTFTNRTKFFERMYPGRYRLTPAGLARALNATSVTLIPQRVPVVSSAPRNFEPGITERRREAFRRYAMEHGGKIGVVKARESMLATDLYSGAKNYRDASHSTLRRMKDMEPMGNGVYRFRSVEVANGPLESGLRLMTDPPKQTGDYDMIEALMRS